MSLLLTILLCAGVIALVAYAAYCQDQALREAREAMDDTAGDGLTPADLIRLGFVSPDGKVHGSNRDGTAVTPEQWARAGEEACRIYMAERGMTPTPEHLREAREAAVDIACGSAAPGRDECGGSSPQVGNSGHSVIGAAGMPSTPSPSEQGAGDHV